MSATCTTCGGQGCEEGCGQCEYANVGPDSHKVCRACHGAGVVAERTYLNAYTQRASTTNRRPIIHAVANPPERYSRTGATYKALCGSQVRNVTITAFNPHGAGRLCKACAGAALT